MAPSTKVLCLHVLVLSLFLCNMEARESRFFDKEPAYDNPAGGSNTAGYGEGYTRSGLDNAFGTGSGNGYGSYRGEGNVNGYVYGDSEASRTGSGSEARYGEAGSGYRSGSARAGEYYSENSGVGNDVSAEYKESSAKGAGSGYRSEAYVSGAGSDWHGTNAGYGQRGDQYKSGYGGRKESAPIDQVMVVAISLVPVTGMATKRALALATQNMLPTMRLCDMGHRQKLIGGDFQGTS